VKWTSWGFLALIGSLVFLVLYLKDRQIRGGEDRLHQMESLPQSALRSPDLKLAHWHTRLSTSLDVQERECVVE
jgi:hypothetical protein